MVYGLWLSAAGMAANQYRQNVSANNIANINTVGFKKDLAMLVERPVEDLRRGAKISVLAVTDSGGQLTANPAGNHIIRQGDHLVVMGTDEQLKTLANM